MGRKSFAGFNIGGIAETQEMLDFCAKYNITADSEIIQIQEANEAFERLEKWDVKYRFVIDMVSLENLNAKKHGSTRLFKCPSQRVTGKI